MATEIEYKFLVKDLDAISHVVPFKIEDITQGYLTTDKKNTARVRIAEVNPQLEDNNRYYVSTLTIKGPTVGISRKEFEYEIPMADAKELLLLCGERVIQKTRYHIKEDEHVVELDVFEGRLRGLVVAEIEVKSESEKITLPNWLGENVSQDFRYTNVSLAMDSKVL